MKNITYGAFEGKMPEYPLHEINLWTCCIHGIIQGDYSGNKRLHKIYGDKLNVCKQV